ncbi:bifunctional ADP-dependent NAD(P)H-hydrate dehydratase/NAD(P)H-hydrate epimerase [Megalodesulfovibrio gigas]|uniref:Bifunctional NAD(P)H-hydrate repair enzyme n=1 Tax=Megalodesulfovibrio gigas (strain ATCC 19364 / DSM 1382 / NCIMB 9332 / VKM B-1759) TaxID=1121448 RepID=T2GEA5_MEGG1|nr:bifunctional ADP-dependent NAD(P)H-hydrate dehydratase/NAD(P)H-hydrate epimerase [Megalodesulfovibrio gigas]AGW14237.1 putative carbohydrate kinase [Megalodesulfovibrio gigas DSM 1382 = ATCC 19364]
MNPLRNITAALCTPAEMARWDREAMAFGIPGEMLMENASREALHVLLEETGDPAGKRILLFAGHGNNGGDAFCMARHLHDQGAHVRLYHTKPPHAHTGETAFHMKLAQQAGVPMQFLDMPSQELLHDPHFEPDIVVDGLLGTGLTGEMRPPFPLLVRAINALRHRAFVFAIDIPSGLDGHTGRPCPDAVRAHATATFAAVKTGLAMPAAREYTGRLHVRHIGIPRQIKDRYPAGQRRMGRAMFRLLRQPAAALHKGTAGHVCIIGGSPGMSGAPALAAMGALRAGAGLVTIACPGAIVQELKSQLPEAMCLGLTAGATCSGGWDEGCLDALREHLPRFDALVVGPGLGRHPDTEAFVRVLHLLGDRPPTVWDADALFWIARNPDWLNRHTPADVLTPHPGELARLLQGCGLEMGEDRFINARTLRARLPGVLVAKDAGTVVVSGDEPAYYCDVAAPCLATGGSGDVLAGCLGALMGLGHPPLEAACLAVLLHAEAGRLLETDYPYRGNLAREIADALPRVMKELSPC